MKPQLDITMISSSLPQTELMSCSSSELGGCDRIEASGFWMAYESRSWSA